MNPVFEITLGRWILPDTIIVSAALTLILGVLALIGRAALIRPGIGLWQTALEMYTDWIRSTVGDIVDDDPSSYAPLIGGLILFIATSNLLSVVPFVRPPTADLSTSVALALIVMLAVPFYGLRKHGLWGYLRTYVRPHPLMLPFNLIAEFTRTLALAVRLFGNVVSGQLIGAVVLAIAGALAPVPLMMLGLLTGLVQAYIFGILATVFIAAAVAVDTRRVKEATHG